MMKTKVIIWGVDDYNVLGLCRQFKNSEFDVLFLAYRGSANCAVLSKYCNQFVETLSIEDGFNYLMNKCADSSNRAVLINSNDLIAEFIDKNSEKLLPFFTITGTTTPGTIENYDNKATMCQLAGELGFNVPQTIICKWNTDISDVEYPCILKPSHQIQGRYNEFKYKICKNKAQLKNTLRFVRRESEFLLQHYIPK